MSEHLPEYVTKAIDALISAHKERERQEGLYNHERRDKVHQFGGFDYTFVLKAENASHDAIRRFAEKPAPCGWQSERDLDGDEHWVTGCDQAHLFGAGTWGENNYKYCPYCGGKIIEVGEEPAC